MTRRERDAPPATAASTSIVAAIPRSTRDAGVARESLRSAGNVVRSAVKWRHAAHPNQTAGHVAEEVATGRLRVRFAATGQTHLDARTTASLGQPTARADIVVRQPGQRTARIQVKTGRYAARAVNDRKYMGQYKVAPGRKVTVRGVELDGTAIESQARRPLRTAGRFAAGAFVGSARIGLIAAGVALVLGVLHHAGAVLTGRERPGDAAKAVAAETAVGGATGFATGCATIGARAILTGGVIGLPGLVFDVALGALLLGGAALYDVHTTRGSPTPARIVLVVGRGWVRGWCLGVATGLSLGVDLVSAAFGPLWIVPYVPLQVGVGVLAALAMGVGFRSFGRAIGA